MLTWNIIIMVMVFNQNGGWSGPFIKNSLSKFEKKKKIDYQEQVNKAMYNAGEYTKHEQTIWRCTFV